MLLANMEQLADESMRTTGYVQKSGEGFLKLRGRSGTVMKIQTNLENPPPPRTEVLAVVRVSENHELHLLTLSTYRGTASRRVFLSLLTIPVIAALFLMEFKFNRNGFAQRRSG